VEIKVYCYMNFHLKDSLGTQLTAYKGNDARQSTDIINLT